VHSILGAKGSVRLAQDEVVLLSSLVVQAFLSVAVGRSSVDDVRVWTAVGRPVSESRVLVNAVVIDTLLPSQIPVKFLDNSASGQLLSVVLYDVSLMFEATAGLEVRTTGHTIDAPSLSEKEAADLTAIGERFVAMNVTVVGTQKLMHPFLEAYLVAHGILPLQRLSVRHIAALQRLTGARVLSSWRSRVDSTCFGVVKALRVMPKVSGHPVLEVIGCGKGFEITADSMPNAVLSGLPGNVTASSFWESVCQRTYPVTTLAICHTSSHAANELSVVIKVSAAAFTFACVRWRGCKCDGY
jgi:hypothetical protein